MSTDLEVTAWHEAGHAVARAALGLPFRYVTIRPRDRSAHGRVVARPMLRPTHLLLLDAAAGPVAELRYYTDVMGEDDEGARWLLGLMGGTVDDDAAIEHLSAVTKDRAYEQADQFLKPLWGAVVAVAGRLLASRATLSYREVREIVGSSLQTVTSG